MMKTLTAAILLVVLATGTRAADDVLVADFEGKDWGDWKVTGEAFGPGPARGTLPNQMPVTGFAGKGLANSYHGGDNASGTLTSPEFTVNRKYLTFLIGGGGFEDKTCINLLVDGKPVRTATGPNTKPGGSEALGPHAWDVAAFDGKAAHLEIVDAATGGWGHINVDQIVLTDRPVALLINNASREVALTGRYLNLPVKINAPKRHMQVVVDGAPVRDLTIELSDAEPQFYV